MHMVFFFYPEGSCSVACFMFHVSCFICFLFPGGLRADPFSVSFLLLFLNKKANEQDERR